MRICKYCSDNKAKEIGDNSNTYSIPDCVSTIVPTLKSKEGFRVYNYCSSLCTTKDLYNMIEDFLIRNLSIEETYDKNNVVTTQSNKEKTKVLLQKFKHDKEQFFKNN